MRDIRASELSFSRWTKWAERSEISDTKYPGVYLLRLCSRKPRGRSAKVRDAHYIGMTNSRKGLLGRCSFQPEQLAREYVLALRDAAERKPILFLILGAPPPVQVSRTGKMAIPDAIHKHLPRVLAESEGHELNLAQATDIIAHAVCWTTWQEISDVVAAQQQAFNYRGQSVKSSINRLADSVTRAIARHA